MIIKIGQEPQKGWNLRVLDRAQRRRLPLPSERSQPESVDRVVAIARVSAPLKNSKIPLLVATLTIGLIHK